MRRRLLQKLRSRRKTTRADGFIARRLIGQKLQRDALTEGQIVGAINLAHAALAQQRDDAVAAGNQAAGEKSAFIDQKFGGTGNDNARSVCIANGNIYVASKGVAIYTSQGKFLKMIPFPETPANLAFGGKDRKTLYVTARTSIYRVAVPDQGPQ